MEKTSCSYKINTATCSHNTSSQSVLRSDVTSSNTEVGEMTSGDVAVINNTHEQIHEDESQSKLYMSVVMFGSSLGAAHYDAATCVLSMVTDVIETADLCFLNNLLTQVQPDFLITSSKQKEYFLEKLRAEQSDDDASNVFKLEILPSNVFAFQSCKQRILGIHRLPGLHEDSSDDQRMIYFSSLMNFDNTSMVCAAGSLLKFLDQSRVGLELDTGTQVPVLYLKTVTINKLMSIESHTLSALQIFQKESHPSVYKCSASGKEGLSLFGIMNHTKSQQGFCLLRDWFLRPSVDLSLIRDRLTAITFFANPRNAEYLMTLNDAMKHMKNITRILGKMKSAAISLNEWRSLYKTLVNAACVADVCHRLPCDIVIVKQVCDTFADGILQLANLIRQIIDFDESSHVNHFVVKEGVDEDLDEKKRTFNGIPFLMTKVAQEELSQLNKTITKCSVTYLPQLGYLLNIPLTEEMKTNKNFNVDERLDFRFLTEDAVYYKSEGTEELDLKVGDIQCEIRDHETAIMYRLQDKVLEQTLMLVKVVEVSAELDCLLALTNAANELKFVCPQVLEAEENVVDIKGGRHPLQELCVNQFVVNDTNVKQGEMKILTGPNACGKSVYMKQVGIIVYLAHLGSFVPAESACISIRDGLFARIHSKESVSVPLSTFMLDLNQVSSAVNRASKHSLVIMDEFGKGTAASDGLALLAATLRHWTQDSENSPAVFVSTHFHALKRLLPPSPNITYQTMSVMEGDMGELVFLYQLKEGYAEYSYACDTARAARVPEKILVRAKQVTELIRNDEVIQKSDQQSHVEKTRLARVANSLLDLDLATADIQGYLATIAQM